MTAAAIVRIDAEGTGPQIEFWHSQATFRVLSGGIGSGKTYAGAMECLLQPAGSVGMVVTPTEAMADEPIRTLRKIAGPAIAEVRKSSGARSIRLLNGTEIFFRSADNPDRLRGPNLGWFWMDEGGQLKNAEAWQVMIGRLRLQPGRGWVTTTPAGYNWLYDAFVRSKHPGAEVFTAPTRSNTLHENPGFFATVEASYTGQFARQELEGEFVNLAGNRVYEPFTRERNHAPATWKSGEALHIGMDFNVMNMTAIVCVIRDDSPVVLTEMTGVRDTPQMCAMLAANYPGRALVIYPDASGASRKSVNAQESDIALLKQAGFTVRVSPSNPAVKDRVQAVNAAMPRLRIDIDACPRLTEALEMQAYDKNGEPDKATGHDHATDALGYFIAHRWPIAHRRASVSTLRI